MTGSTNFKQDVIHVIPLLKKCSFALIFIIKYCTGLLYSVNRKLVAVFSLVIVRATFYPHFCLLVCSRIGVRKLL